MWVEWNGRSDLSPVWVSDRLSIGLSLIDRYQLYRPPIDRDRYRVISSIKVGPSY